MVTIESHSKSCPFGQIQETLLKGRPLEHVLRQVGERDSRGQPFRNPQWQPFGKGVILRPACQSYALALRAGRSFFLHPLYALFIFSNSSLTT